MVGKRIGLGRVLEAVETPGNARQRQATPYPSLVTHGKLPHDNKDTIPPVGVAPQYVTPGGNVMWPSRFIRPERRTGTEEWGPQGKMGRGFPLARCAARHSTRNKTHSTQELVADSLR